MRELKVKGIYNVTGRGLLFSISLTENGIEEIDNSISYLMNTKFTYDHKRYLITGIESAQLLIHPPKLADTVGLLSREVDILPEGFVYTNEGEMIYNTKSKLWYGSMDIYYQEQKASEAFKEELNKMWSKLLWGK